MNAFILVGISLACVSIAFALLKIARALNNIAGAIRGHGLTILSITNTITGALAESTRKGKS